MKNSKSYLNMLKQRVRFVLLDEQSYEEISATSLSRFQLITRVLSILLFVSLITSIMIALTPLREYIPGYSPPHLSKDLIYLSLKTDSLLEEIQLKDQKMLLIESILSGKELSDTMLSNDKDEVKINSGALKASSRDSSFRAAVEREDRFNVLSEGVEKPVELRNIVFYAPIKGIVTDGFDLEKEHYGIDVVAPENEAIKACLEGTVLFSDWTTATGYTIAIQHGNNLVTFYKHNSVLLKKEGELVKAGDVIAIIGNSGELSTGPHLHFELWYEGKAINPAQHILF